MRHQRSVMASDNDTTTTSGLRIVHAVFRVKASLGACFLEDIGVLVASDASDVKNRVGREDVLLLKDVHKQSILL